MRKDRANRRPTRHSAQAEPGFKRPYDTELYRECNVIHRFFNKLNQFRRVAPRYDKLLANFMGFVKLAAIAIWLKYLNRHYELGHGPAGRASGAKAAATAS
jgi:transposase